jgi:hypothetical protein
LQERSQLYRVIGEMNVGSDFSILRSTRDKKRIQRIEMIANFRKEVEKTVYKCCQRIL